MKKPSVPPALEIFISRFRNLVQAARSNKQTKSTSKRLFMFVHGRLGGITLRGRQADLFHECQHLLLQVHPKGEDGHLLSKDEAGALLRTTLFETIRADGPSESETFDRKLETQISRLRSTLLAEPREWGVALRVVGLAEHSLPFTFGLIEFAEAAATTKLMAARIQRATRGIDPTPESLAAEHKGRRELRRDIKNAFAGGVVAQTRVRALDVAAARNLAVERTRRTVDAINFFAPFFRNGPPTAPVIVAPSGKRVPLPYFAWVDDGESGRFNEDDQDIAFPAVLETSGPRAVEIGLTRAHELLRQDKKTDLDKRILNALSWAGRATVEYRADQSFVMYTVCIEALLGKHEARSGVTDRLRRRVVALIGNKQDERRAFAKRITDLYQLRSQIVHAGDFSEMSTSDLKALAYYAEQCIVTVLTDPAIQGIKSVRGLMTVLDERGKDL